MRGALAILFFASLVAAEVIDRIAATVDNQVITASEIDEAVRVAAFLNGEKPDLGPAVRRRMADRLIEQVLVRREMRLTRFPEASAADIAEALKQLKARYGGEARFQDELAADKLSEAQVASALGRQITLLRFIDLRFRPEVQVQDGEVQQYYDTVFLPQIRAKGIKPEPSFDEARAQCEQAVAARLVDKRVDAWLAEARTRARIVYDEDAFR
jgi:parvulin-like peptidyl-prolyl isomerase